ncbi:MAG: tRNA (adenine-N1)-methyltransferase, partial [Chloroflexi bacterium]|nr:tRNA (adenine-N1)-methyltransferase [Chloroflexota bacterium]
MSNEPDRRRAPLADGDVIILYDRRRRRYRVTLAPGALFETHLGYVPHDELIGRTEGFTVLTNKRHRMLVLRPTFAEGVLDLPRQSQVIYPKDLGAILMHADLYPGAHVVEVGLGSGAAAAAVLRAIGPAGALTSYEVREEIVAPARRNVAELAPGAENHTIVVADAYDGIAERGIDRVLVDIPEPWRLLDGLAETLRMGGIVLSYLPTVL